MSGRASGPPWARDRVLQLREGGDEQPVLLGLDPDFSSSPGWELATRNVKSGVLHRTSQPSRGRQTKLNLAAGRAQTTPIGALVG
jgi:hypothetical protein